MSSNDRTSLRLERQAARAHMSVEAFSALSHAEQTATLVSQTRRHKEAQPVAHFSGLSTTEFLGLDVLAQKALRVEYRSAQREARLAARSQQSSKFSEEEKDCEVAKENDEARGELTARRRERSLAIAAAASMTATSSSAAAAAATAASASSCSSSSLSALATAGSGSDAPPRSRGSSDVKVPKVKKSVEARDQARAQAAAAKEADKTQALPSIDTPLIVDIYNIMPCDGSMRALIRSSRTKAAAAMVDKVERWLLTTYAHDGGGYTSVSVVLDYGTRNTQGYPSPSGLTTQYAAGKENIADDLIVDLVAEAAARGQVPLPLVVTSDRELRARVSALGGTSMNSGTFNRHMDAAFGRQEEVHETDGEMEGEAVLEESEDEGLVIVEVD